MVLAEWPLYRQAQRYQLVLHAEFKHCPAEAKDDFDVAPTLGSHRIDYFLRSRLSFD
jgi:hypothetical protein